MSNILMVGGTWDKSSGKESSLVFKMAGAIRRNTAINKKIMMYNGGSYNGGLQFILGGVIPPDIILWMPNISNEFSKLDIKKMFPRSIVITTKRNVDKKYSFQDIIAHGLSKKSNLIIEIQRENDRYVGRLLDPLGNQWFPTDKPFTDDFEALAVHSIKRAIQLSKITRVSTVQSPESVEPIPSNKDTKEFFKVVKDSAEVFHKLIQPSDNIERFLGNASFRCNRGFPSFKLSDGRIYMSRRNIDKRYIGKGGFVQVGWNKETGNIWYRGNNKPSVDTAVQLMLYDFFTDIGLSVNYMVHSHVYVVGGFFTNKMIPCGGIEEVNEVRNVILNKLEGDNIVNNVSFAVNLIGHGSILFMSKPSDVRRFTFFQRPIPEIQL